jgi:hypothetical protein
MLFFKEENFEVIAAVLKESKSQTGNKQVTSFARDFCTKLKN